MVVGGKGREGGGDDVVPVVVVARGEQPGEVHEFGSSSFVCM